MNWLDRLHQNNPVLKADVCISIKNDASRIGGLFDYGFDLKSQADVIWALVRPAVLPPLINK